MVEERMHSISDARHWTATLISVAIVLLRLTVTGWAGGNERQALAARLRIANLALPDGVADILSAAVPEPVLKELMGFKRPTLMHFALMCVGTRQTVVGDSTVAVRELFCACTDAWTTSYLVVLRKEGGSWTEVWDTTRARPLPNILVDTMRLGIEPTGYPTMVASGIAGPKAPREFVLLSWDGKRATVLSQKPMVGQWMDAVDVNGDGIMELDLPLNGDKEGTYVEQVFTFDKPSKSYKYVPGLKTGRYEKKDPR